MHPLGTSVLKFSGTYAVRLSKTSGTVTEQSLRDQLKGISILADTKVNDTFGFSVENEDDSKVEGRLDKAGINYGKSSLVYREICQGLTLFAETTAINRDLENQ